MDMNFSTLFGSRRSNPRDRLLDGLKSLARDAEDLIKATTETASDRATHARARLTDTLDRALETCQELQHQGVRSARTAVRKADRTVRRHPYGSIGLAVAIGALLVLLLRRR